MPWYYREKEEFEWVPLEKIKPYIELAEDMDVKVLIALAWLTGARISELLELTPMNFLIDPDRDTFSITIKAKKKGKTGFPTFSLTKDPFIQDLILPYINSFSSESKLFGRSKRRYQQILEQLNKTIHPNDKREWITFHYLRHSRLTYLARKLYATPEELKSWTGHKSSAFEEYFAPRKVERFKGKIK